MNEYLTQKELAERLGVTLWTVQSWRKKTRAGRSTGPPFEDLGLTPLNPYALRIRYKLSDVLVWETANGITPKNQPQLTN